MAWLLGVALAFVAGRYSQPLRRETAKPASVSLVTAVPVAPLAAERHVTPGARWAATAPATTRDVGVSDPLAALAVAHAEPSRLRRERLRTAALRDWAATAPEDAARWVGAHLPIAERDAALAVIIEGAAVKPPTAVAFVRALIGDDPERAFSYGHTLVTALTTRGEFTAAADFAATNAEWTNTAFCAWAQHEPESALRSALALPPPELRQAAFTGVIAGWAPDNPAGLAEHSQQLPPGPERTEALAEALRHWVAQDPVAASSWMDNHGQSPDLDAGAAAVATFPALIAHHRDVALAWADRIVDPTLRAHTRAIVLEGNSP